MKTKSLVRVCVLLCAVVTVSLLLVARHNRGLKPQRMNSASNLKQIGLTFRMWRNDFNGQFTLTSPVTTTNAPNPK